MPADTVRFGFVIEGKGEIEAIPVLVRRICHEIFGMFALQTTRPVLITKSRLIRKGELERALRLVQKLTAGPILVVLDADEDCPAVLGPELKSRSRAIVSHESASVVIPTREFETWFLTAAESLSGKRGLRQGLVPPPIPEGVQGAKEWLNRNMVPGRRYSPSIDQAALASCMDLEAARSCESFDRLCREIKRLIAL